MLLLLDDDCGTFVLFFNEDDGCDVGAVLCFLIADDDDDAWTGGCFVDEEDCIFFLADEPCWLIVDVCFCGVDVDACLFVVCALSFTGFVVSVCGGWKSSSSLLTW